GCVVRDDAVIDAGTTLGPSSVVQPSASVGPGCSIGAACVIGVGAVVLDGCKLGDRVNVDGAVAAPGQVIPDGGGIGHGESPLFACHLLDGTVELRVAPSGWAPTASVAVIFGSVGPEAVSLASEATVLGQAALVDPGSPPAGL